MKISERPSSRIRTPLCYRHAIAMARTTPELHKTTVYLTPAQYSWLRHKAFARTTTIAALLRDLAEGARLKEDPQDELPMGSTELTPPAR